MISPSVSIISAFVLGALHALEPGHGKSIVALHTVQSRKISEAFSLLASLLVSHFILVVVVSSFIYFNADWFQLDWIQLLAPVVIIFYGLFLLIKSRKNSDEYMACACSHDHDKNSTVNKGDPILMGAIAGLTPCPSVFAPIIIAMTMHQVDQIFTYLIAYISGVISLFVGLTVCVYLLKNTARVQIEHLVSRFNPHLLSGVLMVGIGVLYLIVGVLHKH